ncbi:hypothetical protein CXF33_09005, partial [Corynebacterium bovis]
MRQSPPGGPAGVTGEGDDATLPRPTTAPPRADAAGGHPTIRLTLNGPPARSARSGPPSVPSSAGP